MAKPHECACAAQAATIPAGSYVKLAPGADSLPECSEGPLKPGVYGGCPTHAPVRKLLESFALAQGTRISRMSMALWAPQAGGVRWVVVVVVVWNTPR